MRAQGQPMRHCGGLSLRPEPASRPSWERISRFPGKTVILRTEQDKRFVSSFGGLPPDSELRPPFPAAAPPIAGPCFCPSVSLPRLGTLA